MEYLKIEGNAHLVGTVKASASKNAALPILAGAVLSAKPVKFNNLPNLRDIRFMLKILEELGAEITKPNTKSQIISISFGKTSTMLAPYEEVSKMRASILVLAPIVARYGKAKVSMPGGCAIGARPIDLHTMVLEKLGVKIESEEGYIIATAKKLVGNTIVFPMVSVGATQTAMIAASVAEGTTILKNVSIEPETVELGYFLERLGAKFEGLGTKELTIHGTGTGTLAGTDEEIYINGDRIEAGTYLIAAAATKGKIRVEGIVPKMLDNLVYKLKESGADTVKGDDYIEIDARNLKNIKPVDIVTAPYPGFATDLQAQWMAYMLKADGVTTITENIFNNRFIHVAELARLGAKIKLSGNVAMVIGGKDLKGAPVMATDLRASASLVIAGLVASGTTELHRIYHIDRGYEDIDKKLNNIGAHIERLVENK